jgi:hypothetical protein
VNPIYSARSATTGSSATARRAGRYPLPSGAHAGAAAALLQRLGEGRPRGAQRGESGDAGIEALALPAGHVAQDLGGHVDPHLARPQRGQGKCGGDPAGRHYQPLGQELAHDSATIGAQGEAHGELTLPLGAPREHEVRHVHAGDEQHQGRGHLPEADDGARAQPDILEAALQAHHLYVARRVRLGMLLLQALRHHGHGGPGLLESAPRGQQTEHVQVVRLARSGSRRRQHQGRPHLGAFQEPEPSGRDPDHAVGLTVDENVCPTIPGSLAKLRRHRSCPSTTWRCCPSSPSSARNPRPSTGTTPSASKKPGDTRNPCTLRAGRAPAGWDPTSSWPRASRTSRWPRSRGSCREPRCPGRRRAIPARSPTPGRAAADAAGSAMHSATARGHQSCDFRSRASPLGPIVCHDRGGPFLEEACP